MLAPVYTLTVREADGTPSVAGVRTFVVPNGSLTDDGGGQVTLTITVPVSSVFGRTGAVVAAIGDYTAAQVTNAARLDAANALTGTQTVTASGATAPNLVLQTAAAQSVPALKVLAPDLVGVYGYFSTDNTGGYDGGVFRVQRQALASEGITLKAGDSCRVTIAQTEATTVLGSRGAGPNQYGVALYATAGGRGTTGLFLGLQAGGSEQGMTNSVLPCSASAAVDNTIVLGGASYRFAGVYSVLGNFSGAVACASLAAVGDVSGTLLYAAAVGADWNGTPPASVKEALDRIAAMLGPIL